MLGGWAILHQPIPAKPRCLLLAWESGQDGGRISLVQRRIIIGLQKHGHLNLRSIADKVGSGSCISSIPAPPRTWYNKKKSELWNLQVRRSECGQPGPQSSPELLSKWAARVAGTSFSVEHSLEGYGSRESAHHLLSLVEFKTSLLSRDRTFRSRNKE